MEIWVLGILLLSVVVGGDEGGVAGGSGSGGSSSCGFPAIYNFGDNNSDTGQHQAMFADLDLPNGQTFFGKSSGRLCDGRLVIDFIAEHLGLPFLSAYLDSYQTNFRQGANFALGGKNQSSKRPEDFSNALYVIDIGQNDFAFKFQKSTVEEARKSIPAIANATDEAVYFLHSLYAAKFFLIHNVGPVGCLPYSVRSYQKKSPGCTLDQHGCVKEQNEVVQEYNRELKERVSKLRTTYPNATFTYVDVYSAKYNLISNAKNLLGLNDPMKFCCGSYDDRYVPCGRKNSDGTVTGSTACKDPAKYIFWDGVHYTVAANQFVAKLIINGSLSDPPLPLAQACSEGIYS